MVEPVRKVERLFVTGSMRKVMAALLVPIGNMGKAAARLLPVGKMEKAAALPFWNRRAVGAMAAGLLSMGLLLGGCGSTVHMPAPMTVSIAEQYGLAYAPVQIMREKGYLEAALSSRAAPGQTVEVKWVKLANTTAIREGMLAGDIDVAFTGIPPFLVGVDQGMSWRMISGLSQCPVNLYVNDPAIRSLADLEGDARIALPQPGSIQHILLAMAAERTLGRADAFDRQLVSMKHPDGMQALLSGKDITAHFTSPPYGYQEAETPGISLLLEGDAAMGEPFSFLVGIADPSFFENGVELDAFHEAMRQAMTFIAEHHGETAALLAQTYGLTESQTTAYLYDGDMRFDAEIRGTETFVSFMTDNGYLQKAPELSALFVEDK